MQQTKPIEMRQTRRSWSILGAKRRTIRGG
uniref:Uncharacterized protein n=1 Tax=Rhizophora mucronata TaxID=61149 RepID=A0A2P2IUA6_RHIMU